MDLKICDPAMGSGAFLVEACRQLGDELVKAWHVHNCVPRIPPDEDELLQARRVIAQRCLYGVDKNPMAVDLAKLSLWLATLAKDHPFTFLDHALRAGDSLVGLTRQQISDFDWESGIGGRESGSSSPSPKPKSQRPAERQLRLGQEHVVDRIERATKARKEILDAGDTLPPELKAQKLTVADEALDTVRFFGDLCIAAFFAGEKVKRRTDLRGEYLDALTEYLHSGDPRKRPTKEVDALRKPTLDSPHPISPFHWEIEFPEVFGREKPGFDAIVGNPPFVGGTLISGRLGDSYLSFICAMFPGSGNRMDLVAYFFRRAFSLLRAEGCFGLVATNTIAQGDTREGGLEQLATRASQIYAARRRVRWPGDAAVVVSVVHICRGDAVIHPELDQQPVRRISAYLLTGSVDRSPYKLQANAATSFEGVKPYGQGFLFADDDPKASPTAEMHRLMTADQANAQRIRPYIGGEEVNKSPTLAPTRYAITFDQMTLEEASRWPALLAIVEQRVKPERATKAPDVAAWPWWQYWRSRPELTEATRGLQRVLVLSRLSQTCAFAFLPSGWLYSERLDVFAFETYSVFCVLQSRIHEMWARFRGSSMKDDLLYTPTDCFETFPFPEGFASDLRLEAAGKAYYEFRAALMVHNDEGLTKTYNRFHDPGEASPEIARLRELHAAMDRAVLDAYGWTEIPTDCGFALDYLDIEDEDDLSPEARDRIAGGDLFFPDAALAAAFNAAVATGRRRLPWRHRWPDDIRDEVLARLLALNAERAEEERLSGKAAAATERTKAKEPKRGRRKKEHEGQMLIDVGEESEDE